METLTVMEEQIIYLMRQLPDDMQHTLLKTAEELRDEQEDEADIRDALDALKEDVFFPAEEVYKRLGISDSEV